MNMDTQSGSVNSERTVPIKDKRLLSTDLFLNTNELVIVHNDEEYKLRITGNKKLILTK